MKRENRNKIKERGITLIALVITIVILIILAVVTVNGIFGEDGLIAQANRGKEETEIADAREKLSVVLSSAYIEKHKNPEYNEEEFLDEYI